MLTEDFKPKFVYNLLTTYNDNNEQTVLDIAGASFEISTADANIFLQFRGLCTGHHSIGDIAQKTGISHERITSMIDTFSEIGMLRKSSDISLEPKVLTQTVLSACELWAAQLADTNIFNDILYNQETLSTLKGWLLETYHYIKTFPHTVQLAASLEADPHLKNVFEVYAGQEMGHEEFVLNCLTCLGFTRNEVENSIPLVTTRMISLLMNEMVTRKPSTILCIAKMIEASEFDLESVNNIRSLMSGKYGISGNSLNALFEHTRVDYELGHETLLDENIAYLSFSSEQEASDILNRLHDIKHAFDAQKLEIKDYYNHDGNYVPRQRVDYYAI